MLTDNDWITAATKLPDSTIKTPEGGWRYSFANEMGDEYVFEIWLQPRVGLYFARMHSPRVSPRIDEEKVHVSRDGHLCLSPESGMPDLESCYARTVAFSLGWSVYLRTGEFPMHGMHDS